MTKKITVSAPACGGVAPAGLASPVWAYSPECWGESGSDELGMARSQRLHGTAFARKGAYEGDPLVYAFVGRQSRLVWWYGTTGSLREAMPVLSESQVDGDDNEEGESLKDRLADLWFEWRSESPTMAASLVGWVDRAILVTEALRSDMEEQSLDFIAFDEDDYLEEVPGELFKQSLSYREHLTDSVVDWFRRNCSEYRASESGVSLLDDRPIATGELSARDFSKWREPKWFRDKDPIRSLPAAERTECLDFLEALTGQPIHDTKPRLGRKKTVSYQQVSEFIEIAREYERVVSLLDDLRWVRERATKEEIASHFNAMDYCARSLDKYLLDFGYAPSKSRKVEQSPRISDAGAYNKQSAYASLVRARRRTNAEARQQSKSGGDTKTRRQNFESFLLDLLSSVLGESAANDLVVRAMVACDDKSIMREYAPLFHVDRDEQTIVHGDGMKSAFALTTGTHSECVARRIGRHVWETFKSGGRAASREDELERSIAAMLAYRIPCSAAQETELLELVPAKQVKRFKAEWEASGRKHRAGVRGASKQATSGSTREEILEEFSKGQMPHAFNPKDASWLGLTEDEVQQFFTPNARRCVVNPVHLLFHRAKIRRSHKV